MKLRHETVELGLGEPFVSNKGRVTGVRQVIVRVEWQGRVGLGTAVYAKEFGMVEGPVQAALDACGPLLAGKTPFALEAVMNAVEAAVGAQTTAAAAVDLALHDLIGKIAGLPLRCVLGLDALPLPPTGLSLGAMPEAELLQRAKVLAAWPILKLKVTPASDLTTVHKLRNVYKGRLWVDGNGSWDEGGAVAAAKSLAACGVELLEQPVKAGTPDVLGRVTAQSPVTIVADEDCATPADVLRLAGKAHAVNIKLLKCGGLRRALEMIRLARRLGLKVMLGCKTESVLGITAMAQLGGLADYLDLDGHLDVVDDPFTGVRVTDGRLALPGEPGLGVTERVRP